MGGLRPDFSHALRRQGLKRRQRDFQLRVQWPKFDAFLSLIVNSERFRPVTRAIDPASLLSFYLYSAKEKKKNLFPPHPFLHALKPRSSKKTLLSLKKKKYNGSMIKSAGDCDHVITSKWNWVGLFKVLSRSCRILSHQNLNSDFES